MIEAEWLAWDSPEAMLKFIHDKVSDRKWRLFTVSFCRQHTIENVLDANVHDAIQQLERFADGEVGETELVKAIQAIRDAHRGSNLPETADGNFYTVDNITVIPTRAYLGIAITWPARDLATSLVHFGVEIAASIEPRQAARERIRKVFLDTVVCCRDIFGNPFRPATLNRSWLTSTVTSLAQAIYTDRTFDHLPILADALEDAGCTDADILAHCRGGGEHCRDCWVVDLLLGKS